MFMYSRLVEKLWLAKACVVFAGGALLPWSALFLFLGSSGGALATKNVPFVTIDHDKCFLFSALIPQQNTKLSLELVISNEVDLKKIFDSKLKRQSCNDNDPAMAIPKVDFSQRTVLGLWASAPCFATGFVRHVIQDDRNKTITYTVTSIGPIRACMGPGPESLNLISIHKIRAGYKVLFANPPG